MFTKWQMHYTEKEHAKQVLISIALLVIVCGTDTLHVGTCSQGFIPNFPFTQF